MNKLLQVVFFVNIGLTFVIGSTENTTLRIRPGRNISLADGIVQGSEETYGLFRKIHTFKGIPYAKPPVGNLRFKPPIPADPWRGILKANKFGPNCPQMKNEKYIGDEDCLYINVHTPDNIRNFLPVLVFIHGGGIYMGSGNTDLIGPEPIIEDDIIVVTLNYRLGPLGFLNSGDSVYPGNYGLKDIILGLQWVQRNIRFFGGNSNEVTIMGISAGGAAVHALVLSPAATGLFNKAISQSGSLFNPWAFNSNPEKSMLDLAYKLDLNLSNKTEILTKLKEVSAERLIHAASVVDILEPVGGPRDGTFTSTVDFYESEDESVLPDTPFNLLKVGNINKVPFIVGFNSLEMMYTWSQIENEKSLIERYQQNPKLFLSKEWTFKNKETEGNAIQQILNTYFEGKLSNTTRDLGLQWAKYISDRGFVFGISKLFMLHSELQDVYYYVFNYTGSFNYVKILGNMEKYPGAAHGDDMFYLFQINSGYPISPVDFDDEAYKIRERNVRLWSNFIKNGNPTPVIGVDPLITTKWTPGNSVIQNYMDLTSTMSEKTRPFNNRLDVWHRLDKLYGVY